MMRRNHIATVVGIAIGATVAVATGRGPAEANHPSVGALISYYFPSYDWSPMAHREGHNGEGATNWPVYYGGVAVAAGGLGLNLPVNQGFDACGGSNPRWSNMQAVAAASTSSTLNKPELPDWPLGLYMSGAGCSVSPNSHTFMTTFVSATSGGSPGYTYHYPASASQCMSIGVASPCGDWKSVTEVQKSWWDATGRTDFSRRQLLMHEWGHQWGLKDECFSEPSWTHNGVGCSWPTTLEYQPVDRQAFFEIYNR